MATLIYGESIKGNGHYMSGIECQDSNSFDEKDLQQDDIKVIALADGHGGSAYYKSAQGSQIAVKIAKDTMRNFIEQNKSILDEIDKLTDNVNLAKEIEGVDDIAKKEDENEKEKLEVDIPQTPNDTPILARLAQENATTKHNNNKSFDNNIKFDVDENIGIKDKLIQDINNKLIDAKKSILIQWQNEVDKELAKSTTKILNIEMQTVSSMQNDIQINQIIGYGDVDKNVVELLNTDLTESMVQSVIKNPRQIYGTTLTCVARYKNHNFVLKIGDGDVVVLTSENDIYYPISNEEIQILNATNSMCQTNALNNFESIYFNQDIKLIMLCTDGITNALDDDGLNDLIKGLYENIDDAKTFRNDYHELLRKCSTASFDDCTLCFIAENIDQNIVDEIQTTSITCDDTELDKLYVGRLQPYNFNHEVYDDIIKDNDVAENDTALLKIEALKYGFNKLEKQWQDLNKVKEEINGLSEDNQIIIYLKQLSQNKLKQIEDKLTEVYKQLYTNHIDDTLSKNPLIVTKTKLQEFAMGDTGLNLIEETINYGIVDNIMDKNINFISMQNAKENYIDDIKIKLLPHGKIKLNEEIVVDAEEFKIQTDKE